MSNPLESASVPVVESAPPPLVPSPFSAEEFQLNWTRRDIEQRLGFRGGRFTSVNKWLTFLIGAVLTVLFFATLVFVAQRFPGARPITAMFLERGVAPYPTMLLFFWALTILFIKSRKLKLQAEALTLAAVPQQPDFLLNQESARAVLGRVHSLVDHAGHFLLLNRIERALSNLQNIGQVGDVATILRNQAEYDEGHIASSYSLVHSFLWAIPVLGFIGTVLGLRAAIGALGITLKAGGDITAIRDGLQAVTAGLATKFETTLVALVCAVILQLLLAFMQSREAEFLDECNDYCHAHVASKLKLV
jgi:biopolymer transport protein ExbB/TolQ